jgi:50S ribosomal protein L16 3-hydroxylase
MRSYNRAVIAPSALARLGPVSVARFMREAWQRKPLLMRGAFPGFITPVDRDRLFQLARDPRVESRLVETSGGRWSLRHGPFARLPSRSHGGWTVLVQGVNLHDEAAYRLLERFRFVPDARLDDLMVSFASDGGGVGPHVDSYDVFLLQAAGRRRWRISRQRDLRFREDVPLKLLANFRATQEWELEPGDLLYLPPGVAHEGVAIGESLTYSIGFRAPTYQELLEPWLTDFAENTTIAGRYSDPGIAATTQPGVLPAALTSRIHATLSRARPARSDTERFLLRRLTEPKAHVVFERPRRPLSLANFSARACRRGVGLDRRTRLMRSARAVGINGEWIASRADMSALQRLADARELAPSEAASASDGLWPLLHDWYRAGWLHFL